MTLTPRHKQLMLASIRLTQQRKHDLFLTMRAWNDYNQDEDEDWLVDELDELAELVATAPTQE